MVVVNRCGAGLSPVPNPGVKTLWNKELTCFPFSHPPTALCVPGPNPGFNSPFVILNRSVGGSHFLALFVLHSELKL